MRTFLMALAAGALLALAACGGGTSTPSAREQVVEVNGTKSR